MKDRLRKVEDNAVSIAPGRLPENYLLPSTTISLWNPIHHIKRLVTFVDVTRDIFCVHGHIHMGWMRDWYTEQVWLLARHNASRHLYRLLYDCGIRRIWPLPLYNWDAPRWQLQLGN